MKASKWALVGGAALILCGAVGHEARLFLEKRRSFENLFIQTVSPLIKGSADVGKIRFGFLSAHLQDVKLLMPGRSLSVGIKEIRVTLSIPRLLRTHFSPARSIGKVVLVQPQIDLTFPLPDSGRPPPGKRRGLAALLAQKFGIDYLHVKNGVLRIHDSLGRVTLSADALDGRLHGSDTALRFEVKGRFAATGKRNLFISGALSETGGDHRIAARLESTELRAPLTFGGVTLTAGALSGAFDLLVPDSAIALPEIRSTGGVALSHGRLKVAGLPKEIDSVGLRLGCRGTHFTIDSFSARYAHSVVWASGAWDLDTPALSRVAFTCSGLRTDSLGFGAGEKKNGCHRPGKELYVAGEITQARDSAPVLSVRIAGLAKKGILSARGKLRNRRLAFESISLHTPAFVVSGSGTINFQHGFTYSFFYSGKAESLGAFDPRARGAVRFAGILDGTAQSPRVRFEAEGQGLGFSEITFGSAHGSVQSVGEDLIFKAQATSGSTLSAKADGMLYAPFSCTPKGSCALFVRATGNDPALKRIGSHFFRPDTLSITGNLHGWIDDLSSRFSLHAAGPQLSGDLSLGMIHSAGRHPHASWSLQGDSVMIFGAPSSCAGSGRLIGDSLVVDSLALLDRAVVTGSVVLADPVRVNTRWRYDLALKELLKLVTKGSTEADSGRVFGSAEIAGQGASLRSRIEAHLRGGMINGVGGFRTDAVAFGNGSSFTVLPLVLWKDERVIATFDTTTNAPHLRLSGKFTDLDLAALFGPLLEGIPLSGAISGAFCSSPGGLPVTASVASSRIGIAGRQLDSLSLKAAVDRKGIRVVSFRSCDGPRTVVNAHGYLPFSFLAGDANDHDTMAADISAKGDLIATMHRTLSGVIDGAGQGTLDISMSGRAYNWHISRAELSIPSGTLTLKPFLPGKIGSFSCRMTVNDSSLVNVAMSGIAGKRRVRVFSSHEVPAGYRPIMGGPFDFGVIQIETPDHGVEMEIPGMTEKNETGDIEPLGKAPFRYFTLSGPVTSPKVDGELLIRNVYFTYPFLANREKLPSIMPAPASSDDDDEDEPKTSFLSMINWDVDIRAGDRKVIYFRDVGGKNAPIMRLLEATVDQGSSVIHLHGSSNDKTLQVKGIVHSYHGAINFGKTFDRNVEVGVEFTPQKRVGKAGFDNMPILWGSAEAAADTSRIDRIKLTALVQDPVTGALAERGRLCMVNGQINIQLHLSSDFDEIAGESEREFYRQAGVQFTSVGGAGKFVSGFGEQYLNRYFLQRMERKLAKSIGLDVITLETNIASNYFNRFYNRQFENVPIQYDYLALANMGITVGRYVFGDNVFLKASGGLLPLNDTTLTPQYSFGLELQPLRYFFMGVDYGFYKRDLGVEHNLQYEFQLRIPINGVRNLFDF